MRHLLPFQEDFLKLYINHRPVLPLDKQNIDMAFEKLALRYCSALCVIY